MRIVLRSSQHAEPAYDEGAQIEVGQAVNRVKMDRNLKVSRGVDAVPSTLGGWLRSDCSMRGLAFADTRSTVTVGLVIANHVISKL